MTFGTSILSVECEEHAGSVTRNVYPMALTLQNLKTFWELSKPFKTLFNRDIKENFEEFCKLFIAVDGDGNYTSNGLFWVVDDFIGVFYITDISPGLDAKCHFTFFDKKLQGRSDLFRELIRYVFAKYKFRRLTAEVPMYLNRRLREFLEKEVGLKREGFKRQAAFYNNDYFGVAILGILPEDIMPSEQPTQELAAHGNGH